MYLKFAPLLSAVAAALLLNAPVAPLEAQTNDTLTQTDTSATEQDAPESGIWGVACDRDVTGTKTGCRVTQTVVARETGKRLLTVSIRRTPDGADPTVLLTLPLRTFLAPGTMIQVDDGPGRQSPFQLCDENGCYAGLPADESLVDALKTGKTLSVEFYDAKRQKTEIKLPLKTFGESFDKAGS
jgi:invasion protein IalB